MKALETGNDKIQKICDSLKKETLEPARQEAREIVEKAHGEAAGIIAEAKHRASQLMKVADGEMEEKKRVAKAALNLAARQGLEALKQKIEKDLFQGALNGMVEKEMGEVGLVTRMVEAFLKKGMEGEIEIPKGMVEAVAGAVGKKLKAGDFAGGVKVRLSGKNILVDMSDAAVKEQVWQYIRKDLRDLIFGS